MGAEVADAYAQARAFRVLQEGGDRLHVRADDLPQLLVVRRAVEPPLGLHAEEVLPRVRVTRIAMGVPVGSDLEYADEVTMNKAMEGRREV